MWTVQFDINDMFAWKGGKMCGVARGSLFALKLNVSESGFLLKFSSHNKFVSRLSPVKNTEKTYEKTFWDLSIETVKALLTKRLVQVKRSKVSFVYARMLAIIAQNRGMTDLAQAMAQM